MAKRTLGIGIIGTGSAAGAHIDNFKDVTDCEIVAICSRKQSRAAALAEEKGLSDVTSYSKLESFLAHDGLDVVSICTPHPNPPAETIAAARAGKHIVIEKPVALGRDDLKKMVTECNKAGVCTSVCFELHWIGLFKNIKAMIKKGMVGNPFYGEASYYHGIGPHIRQYDWNIKKRMGGDALLTAGCHALDGLIWLMGSRVVEVAAMSNTSKRNPWKFGYDPNSIAILKFENGAIGKVGTSIECRQPYLMPIIIQGDRGTIWNDRFSTLDLPGQNDWGQIPTDLPESGSVDDHPYRGQFQEFLDNVRRGKSPHNDLHAAAHVHEVIFAIQAAIRTRVTVKVRRTPGT
ncbi:MAG: 4,5-dihydroxyphthalate dehydrogenase [Planctomycetes bacterium]|nr:4,5-dihydroxyphthalate dehydrogenase [Planctomycetota bacterium]